MTTTYDKSCEDWQVNQAREAIRMYNYFLDRQNRVSPTGHTSNDQEWKTATDEMFSILRLKHRALATERSYLGWLREFYKFLKGKSPGSIETSDVKHFLIYLAVERNVAPSTQNQAFNAILFFFRHVLDKDMGNLSDTVRAHKKQRVPVALTRTELAGPFDQLSGLPLLMARVIYGCGLRLMECVRLRVKDLDFEMNCLTVRSGKGDKDRQTVLPETLKDSLQEHASETSQTGGNRSKINQTGDRACTSPQFCDTSS